MSAAMGRQDEQWMMRALSLAKRGEGRTAPNPPVGAVVVAKGVLVGEGYHRQAGGHHAEVYALQMAGARARGATLYVTLEPCSTHGRTPPCVDAIVKAGIGRVVVGTNDPNPLHAGRGLRRLRRKGVAVSLGICRKQSDELLAPFEKWVTTGVPYVTLKIGMTLDGRIADRQRKSKWITSAASRKRVVQERRRVDAILVGSGTVQHDDPSLQWSTSLQRNPQRVVVDTAGRTPLNAKVLSDAFVGNTVIATTKQCSDERAAAYRAAGATVLVLPEKCGRVSLRALMKALAKRGILHVLCEGGSELAEAMIRSGVVDRYLFFVAPKVFGDGRALPAVAGQGWLLGQAPEVRFTDVERIGGDVLLTAVPGSIA